MNYEILYAFVIATAALAIAPGPDNIFVFTISLAHGKKYGFATTAGLMSGCLIHTTLLAFGVSALIRQSETLFLGLKIVGACYLLYLAYNIFKSSSEIQFSTNNSPSQTVWQRFRQGFTMNVFNPKVSIFFLAFFPGFLFSDTLNVIGQFYVLGVIFMMISGLIFCGIAMLSGTISITLQKKSAHWAST